MTRGTSVRFAVLSALVLMACWSAGIARTSVAPFQAYVMFGVDDGAMAGQIRLPDGTPARGLRVRAVAVKDGVDEGPYPLQAQVDDSGRYSVNNAPPGRYRIEAGTVDYPSYYPGVKAAADARLVTVVAGRPTLNIDFAMARPSLTVSGRIVPDARQRNSFQTEVRLSNSSWQQTKPTNGQFSFSDVPPGYYIVQVGKSAADGRIIHVDDRNVTGLEVPVPLMVSVSGRVRERNGRPLASTTYDNEGMPVAFFLSFVGGGRIFEASVRPSGEFGVLLPEGSYHVVPSGLPLRHEVVSIAEGTSSLDREPLRIASAEPRTLAMVVENTPEALEPLKEFVVRGRVNNPNGPPDSGSGRVTLANRSGRRLEAKVLPDGSFEFSGVPSDSYYINPAPAPQTFGAEPGPVHVTKDITGLELSVPGEGRLRGSIKVDGKIPAKINLSLRTVSGSGVNLNPALGPDGVFEAAVPAGEFNVAVPMVPPDYYEVKEITSGSGGSTTNKLKIGAGETGEVVVTLGKRLAESKIKVTGRLTGVDGVPGKSVFYREVRLAGGGGAFNQAIRTAEDGAFEFLDVPPGPFTLQIPDALVEIQLVARETNIGPIEVLGRPLKRLTKNLSGRIVIPEGFPAPDVRIEFSGVPGADGVRPRCEYFSSVNSAPDGSFSRSCDEGNYRVIASVFVERLYFEIQGVTNGSRDLRNELLSIGPGATESLTVTLAPRPDAAWRKVSGVVPGKGGVPITLRSGLNWARTVTNPDGTFEFARVVPDNYTVSADAGLGAVVAVDQRDIRGITLLPRAATTVTISGRIDVEGGKGIPQSMILLLTGATPPYATPSGPVYPRIKADGTFTVDIPQGSYRVALADSALPPGYRLKAIEYGATNIQDDILSVNSDARNLRIVLTAPPPQPGVRVAGRVEGLANLGAAQRVILYRDLPFWTDTTAMAADGAFEFSDVPPGTYRIYLETLPRAQILVRVGREDVGGVTVAAPAGPTQQK